ncbi:MAG: hypothetical protein WA374_13120 [Acidobacteriaceae bacterium]
MAFLGEVIAFGVFAFNTGHKRIQDIVFFGCIVLFLIPPVAAIWYFRPFFRAGKGQPGKLMQSSFAKSLWRFITRSYRTVTISLLAFGLFTIALMIRTFPEHPRTSLALIMVQVVAGVYNFVLLEIDTLRRQTYQTFGKVADVVEFLVGTSKGAEDGANKLKADEESDHGTAN